jgi:hypothetical protein
MVACHHTVDLADSETSPRTIGLNPCPFLISNCRILGDRLIRRDHQSILGDLLGFEDLPDLARLLFDDATKSSIAARYSNAVQSGEKLALELCSRASNK